MNDWTTDADPTGPQPYVAEHYPPGAHNPWDDEPPAPADYSGAYPATGPVTGPAGPVAPAVDAPQPSSRMLPVLIGTMTAVVLVGAGIVGAAWLNSRPPSSQTHLIASQGSPSTPPDQTADPTEPDPVPTSYVTAAPPPAHSTTPTATRASSTSTPPTTSSTSPVEVTVSGPEVTDLVADAESVAATDTLGAHGTAINTGDYHAGWALFTPAMQDRAGPFSSWREGVQASTWEAVTVRDVSVSGDTATVAATLRTIQPPDQGHGHSCLIWDLTYTMDTTGYSWLIDKAKGDYSPC